jgi:hypothetical protein
MEVMLPALRAGRRLPTNQLRVTAKLLQKLTAVKLVKNLQAFS